MAPSVSQVDLLLSEREKARQQTLKSSSSSSNYNSKDDAHSFSLSPTPSPSFNDSSSITYLFPDFRALKQIFSKDQVFDELIISGFEIYIVEQWTCERKYSTVISAYTGDSDHSIKVGRLVLPANMSNWSKKMKHFIKEIEESGAKLKLTDHGYLFITNLSQFPSNLNLLHVPGGCVLDVWDYFLVNLNLRKLRCGGRSAIMLCAPADAAEDKFRQIYRTHPKVNIMYAVKELITLVQICLVDFKLLDPLFVDGLFCQKTEEKISEWWTLYGTMYYGITPKDGTLGPTTVASLLGFVLSCSFRLDIAGSDFPKEPFNYFLFRINVGKFQKQYGLEKSWYLDPATVEKLFRVTSKTSKNDISKFKKVVKSTVHDISGKASTEQSAVEVLTTDLEKSIKYFNCSARLEYLWLGKGDIRDLKGFDYGLERMSSSNNSTVPNIVSSSTIRSGVGKIKNLPKILQSDENTPRKRERKVTNGSAIEGQFIGASCTDATEKNSVCELLPIIKKQACCDKIVEFNRSLKRRTTYPYLRKDVAICQLDYGNHSIPLLDPMEEGGTLRRVKSCSFIDESIDRWECQVSEEKLATLYINTKLRLLKTDDISKVEEKKFKQFKRSLEESQMKVFTLKHQTTPIFNSCEYENNQRERANAKIEDIQATGARLEYEIRLLSTKIRDTEESVDDFVRKVEGLEKAVDERFLGFKTKDVKSDEALYWYSRLVNNERLWKYIGRLQGYSPVKWVIQGLGLAATSTKVDESQSDSDDNYDKCVKSNETTTTVNKNERLKQA